MQKQTNEIKDCYTCPGRCPELLSANHEVWELWQTVKTQWRISAFAPVGLDLPAVFTIAEIFEVAIDKSLLQKLKMLERYELKRIQKKEGA